MEILQKEDILTRYNSLANKAFPANTVNPELGAAYANKPKAGQHVSG
jgi:hypothetical protein